MSTFSYSEFEDVIRKFSKEVPDLLKQHHLTSGIAFGIRSLNLDESLEQRFTVAIIGQMRVGKSMLLNSLIERNLAPTGVTETTATINWFRHGQGDICNKFRVHWIDGSEEDFDLNRINEWIGTEKNIESTKSIDFFADADFLKTANIVDTPGTRSVIDTHEKATEGFLSEKLESDTFKFGGKADAVIYVINPVGREADSDILKLFGEATRLPGSSPFNSIAVIQKWEHLQPDPLAQVQQKCERLKQQLAGKVADVIPTSGLIAQHVIHTKDAILEAIAKLSLKSSTDALEMLLLSEDDFTDPCEGASLDVEERKKILTEFSWKILPLTINEIRRRVLTSPKEIRNMLDEISGIPRLREVLEANFFSRSRLIKASSLFKKAWEPATTALIRLHNGVELKEKLRLNGGVALKKLPETEDFYEIRKFIEYADESIENEIEKMRDISTNIDRLKYQAEKAFKTFEGDILALEIIRLNKNLFTEEEINQLNALFGLSGTELESRLRIEPNSISLDKQISLAEDLYSTFSLKKNTSHGQLKDVYEHAVEVLNLILNDLEKI